MTNVQYREALSSDLDAINCFYAKVNFLPSSLKDGERVCLATVEYEIVGVGRIHPVDDSGSVFELGGMLVSEKMRGLNVARKIVNQLIGWIDGRDAYCIPFAHLEKFYGSFGFRKIERGAHLPIKILKKLEYCDSSYPEPVLLMELTHK